MTTSSRKFSQSNSSEGEDLRWLFSQIKDMPNLTKAEEHDLCIKIQTGTPEESIRAQDEIVRRNLKLIVKKARAFLNEGIPLVDLVQEGATGVIRAAEKFDTTRNLKFSTYATPWIKQRMRRAINRGGNLIKISEGRLKELTALKWEYKLFTEREGRSPTPKEIAEILGITVDKAEELGRMHSPYVPLDKPVGEDENLTLGDYVMDDSPMSEDIVENNADKDYVHKLLRHLSLEDQEFIKLKYGFVGDQEERKDRWMAVYLKITIKEVQETEERILNQLREMSNHMEINMSVEMNLIIENIPSQCYNEVYECIKRHSGLNPTMIGVMLRELPVTAFSKRNQHVCEAIKNELEAAGATCSIVKSG